MFNEKELCAKARAMRNTILDMAFKTGKAAHFGGSLSSVELVTYIYNCFLKYDTDNKTDAGRDRFILSKGHCVMSYYAALHDAGFFGDEKFAEFEKDGGDLLSHPVRNLELGIESSNGSLGQGLSFAVGQQIAARMKGLSYRNVVLMGDGECNEGSVWEAAMAAAQYKLSGLVAIVDNNGLQSDGSVNEILDIREMLKNWCALGFDVYEVDGHDFSSIHSAFTAMDFTNGNPKLVIARTIKGKGVSFMENNNQWHHEPITQELYEQAKAELA